MSYRHGNPLPDHRLSWWRVLLGGVAVAAVTFGLLWSIVILGWALEA